MLCEDNPADLVLSAPVALTAPGVQARLQSQALDRDVCRVLLNRAPARAVGGLPARVGGVYSRNQRSLSAVSTLRGYSGFPRLPL